MHFSVETVFEGNLQKRSNLLEMGLEVEICEGSMLNQRVQYYS